MAGHLHLEHLSHYSPQLFCCSSMAVPTGPTAGRIAQTSSRCRRPPAQAHGRSWLAGLMLLPSLPAGEEVAERRGLPLHSRHLPFGTSGAEHHGDCAIANATRANATAANQTEPHSHGQEGLGHSHPQQEPAKKAEGGGVLQGLGLDPVRDAAAAAKEAREAAKEAAASADETANAAHPGATVTGAAW